jgi:hypothetical protein
MAAVGAIGTVSPAAGASTAIFGLRKSHLSHISAADCLPDKSSNTLFRFHRFHPVCAGAATRYVRFTWFACPCYLSAILPFFLPLFLAYITVVNLPFADRTRMQ